LITDATNHQRSRQGEEQIGHEECGLDEARLRLGEAKEVLEVLVQHVQHRMAKTPNEKQRGDHEERKYVRISFLFHLNLGLIVYWLV
jgi:hypothetical protein